MAAVQVTPRLSRQPGKSSVSRKPTKTPQQSSSPPQHITTGTRQMFVLELLKRWIPAYCKLCSFDFKWTSNYIFFCLTAEPGSQIYIYLFALRREKNHLKLQIMLVNPLTVKAQAGTLWTLFLSMKLMTPLSHCYSREHHWHLPNKVLFNDTYPASVVKNFWYTALLCLDGIFPDRVQTFFSLLFFGLQVFFMFI